MDSLRYKTTVKAIKSVVQNLPKGSEALETAYNQAINRIEAQPIEHQILAKRVISWITYAGRPLSLQELTHALAIEPGDQEFDEDNVPELDEISSVCAGLIAIDEESDVVRLTHYTTQEYFGRIRLPWLPDGDAHIATACLTYLSYLSLEDIQTYPNPIYFTVHPKLSRLVFFDYASRYWGSHARLTSDKAVEQLALAFLADEPRVLSSTNKFHPSHRHYEPIRDLERMSSVHLAAYHNLDKLLPIMLNHNHIPDAKDAHGRTPLLWAVIYEHQAVTKVLLELEDVNINSRDDELFTPLYYAARRGNESVTRILLEKNAEINLQGNDDETSLFVAAKYGREAVVKMLLRKKC